MAVLVDYACPTCDSRTEARVPSPPSAVRACPCCGGEARRVWAPVGLMRGPGGGRAPGSHGGHGAPGGGGAPGPPRGGGTPAATTPLCAANPDVPGLCHMSPSAGRAWLARARGDTRALERELARQEAAAEAAPPTLASVVSHHHHGPAGTRDPAGGHGHGQAGTHRHDPAGG
jgi:hypothetical protein